MLTRVKLVAVRKESRVMRWTITNECGDVLARFQSAEEAWAALCSDAFLSLVSERYEEAMDSACWNFVSASTASRW